MNIDFSGKNRITAPDFGAAAVCAAIIRLNGAIQTNCARAERSAESIGWNAAAQAAESGGPVFDQ